MFFSLFVEFVSIPPVMNEESERKDKQLILAVFPWSRDEGEIPCRGEERKKKEERKVFL